jgi:hypothetical protein
MDISTEPKLFEKVYQPLVESLAKITDLGFPKGVRYKLKPFLILLFLSKLGGADRPSEIADWIKFRFLQLKPLLNLEWKKSPHEVTVKRILENALEADKVEQVFGEYLSQLSDEEREQWNPDGQVICGVRSEETDNQLPLLA